LSSGIGFLTINAGITGFKTENIKITDFRTGPFHMSINQFFIQLNKLELIYDK